MKGKLFNVILSISLIISAMLSSAAPVAAGEMTVDGMVDDWAGITALVTDASNDTAIINGTASPGDITAAYATDDGLNIYFRVDLASPVNSTVPIVVIIDANRDGNPEYQIGVNAWAGVGTGALYDNAAPPTTIITGLSFAGIPGSILEVSMPLNLINSTVYPFPWNLAFKTMKRATPTWLLSDRAPDVGAGFVSYPAGGMPTPTPPTVITLPATNVGTFSARINGNLTSLGTAINATVGFQWGTTTNYNDSTNAEAETPIMLSLGNFTTTIVGLDSNTTYHFRAKASGDGVSNGSDMSFKTLSLSETTPPMVVTLPATGFTYYSATLNGNLTSLGTALPVNVSFEWGLTNAYGNHTPPQPMNGIGAFSFPLPPILTSNTPYYFRAIAVGDGVANGSDVTFTTLAALTSTPIIPFVSMRDGNLEIYTMDITGGNQTNVSNSAAYENMPALSPDGAKIAFVSDRDGNRELYVMNVNGTGVMQLTFSNTTNIWPAWSPDGSKIAYNAAIHDVNGTFNYNEEIYVVNANGTGQFRLTNNPATDSHPSWSPNGSKIVFHSTRSGNQQIWVMNANGTNQIRLTNTTDTNGGPAWSPDDSKIAFTSTRDGNNQVYVMNANGTGQTNLSNNTASDGQPVWSSDSNRIIFTSERDGRPEVYVMDANGGNQTRLTATIADNWSRAKWQAPQTITQTATAFTTSGARLNGNLTTLGTASSASIEFEWGLDNTYGNKTALPSMISTGTFYADLSGLSANNTYHFRAVGGGDGIYFGDDMTFTTLSESTPTPMPPTVVTENVTAVTQFTATLNGNLTSLGTATIANVSFVYGTTLGGPYLNSTAPQPVTAGVFSANVTGLTPNKPYYFKARAAGGGGPVFGAETLFITRSSVKPQVAAGGFHTVGLKSDGTVVAVGDNGYGQLNVSGWTGIVQVAAGGWHTVGLKSDGTVVAVGNNDYGQLNVSGWTGITQVAAGSAHTVGLKTDGTVVAVGYNANGQCDVASWNLSATTPPTVVTENATAVTQFTATLNGNLTLLGTALPVNVSFEWGTTTAYGNFTPPQSMNATGTFSFTLPPVLSANTTYHFMAVAVGDGVANGSDVTFVTSSMVVSGWQAQMLPSGVGMVLANGTDISNIVTTGNSSIIYVIDSHIAPGVIYRSTDGGQTFSYTGVPATSAALSSLVVAPDNANVLAVTDHTYVYVSSDGGGTWTTTLPALPGNYTGAYIRSVAMGPPHSGMFYGRQYAIALSDPAAGSTALGDVLLVNNGTWSSVGGGITGTRDYVGVKFAPGTDTVVVVMGVGAAPGSAAAQVINTVNGMVVSTAILNSNGTTTDFAATATATSVTGGANIVLPSDFDATTAAGRCGCVILRSGYTPAPVQADNDVYCFNDTGATALGASMGRVNHIAYSGTIANGTLFAGATDYAMVKYTTGMTGASPTWTATQKLLPATTINTQVRLAPDFATSHKVYVGTSGADSAFSISTDGGITFNQKSLIDYGTADNTIGILSNIAVTQDGGTIFMATKSSSKNSLSLWESPVPPTGVSWSQIYAVGGTSPSSSGNVKLSPDYLNTTTLYFFDCTTNGPIYRSTDGGKTFVMRSAPAGISYSGATIAVADANTLYIGDTTATPNIYKSTDGGLTWGGPVPANITGPIRQLNIPKTNCLLVGGVGFIGYSTDGGSTFPIVNRITGNSTESYRVIASNNFASDNTIFVADGVGATGMVYRYVIGTDASLVALNTPPLPGASVRGLSMRTGILYVQYGVPGNNVTYRTANPLAAPGSIVWTTLPAPTGVTGAQGINLMSLSAPNNVLWATDNVGLWVYADSLPVPPTVVTLPANGITTTSATLNGNLTGMGTTNPVQVYFQWGINSTFTNTTAIQYMSISGQFTANVTGLTANPYIYRAVAVGNGTVYGNNVTFTTLSSTQAVLRIAVTLAFRPSAPNSTWIIPVEVWLHAPGAAWNATAVNDGALYHFNTNTTDSGIIQLMVPPGTYDIRVKGSTTLKNELSNVAVAAPGPVNVNLGTLIEGDVNGDNITDGSDYSSVITCFGLDVNAPGTPPIARMCDFNNDGFTDGTDYSIIITNFGRAGADVQ